jgi:hypothetical protein
MARLGVGVGEGLAGNWHKLPGIAGRVQPEGEHPERSEVSDFAIGQQPTGFQGRVIASARARDKLANPVRRVEVTDGWVTALSRPQLGSSLP